MKIVNVLHNEVKILGILEDTIVKVLEDSNIFSIIENGNYQLTGEALSLEDVKVLAPIEYPKRNILCLGKNYREHALEVEGKTSDLMGVPKVPIYFSKFAYPAIGTGDDIITEPTVTNAVDYEAELAVIIGKQCKKISQEEVKDVIYGYTIANDVSARDLQMKHNQWVRGKSLDTFAPLGPCIVTADEFAYPPNLNIKCSVNNEVRQSANTNMMIFSLDYAISELSQSMTLYPGDIILTGTPEGVGMGFNPPKYLAPGDEVVCEIEGIGKLINYVK